MFEEYEKGVYQKLKHDVNDDSALKDIKKQVSDDLENFAITSAISHVKEKNKFNGKNVFYTTTTLFLSTMGRMYNIQSSSCFGIVEELASENIISEFARHLLMLALTLACEVRLRWYMDNKAQNDEVSNDLEAKTNVITKLFDLIGKASTIKYFHIAYALQCDIAKRLKLQKHHFYSNPTLLNLSIGHSFDDREYLRNFAANPNYKISINRRFLDFDENMKVLTISESGEESENRVSLIKKLLAKIQNCGNHLFEIDLYEEALECFEFVAKRLQQKIVELRDDQTFSPGTFCTIRKNISYNCFLLIKCLMCLKKYAKASNCLKECIQISVKSSDSDYWIGRCLLLLKKPLEALDYFMKSIQIWESESQKANRKNPNREMDSNVVSLNQTNVMCTSFIKTLTTQEVNSTIDVVYKYCWIGNCFLIMKKPEEVLPYFQKALKREEQLSVDLNRDNEVAIIFNRLGFRLKNDLKKLEPAIKYFERSLQIKQVTSQNISVDLELADTKQYLGWCLIKRSKYEKAIPHFQTSLQILEQLSLDVDTDKNIAQAHYAIGYCLMESKKASQAIEHFDKLLQIKKRLSSNVFTDPYM